MAPACLHLYRDHFTQHNYFGLDPNQVRFFQQGFLPCLTAEGQVIMETSSKVRLTTAAGSMLSHQHKDIYIPRCPSPPTTTADVTADPGFCVDVMTCPLSPSLTGGLAQTLQGPCAVVF